MLEKDQKSSSINVISDFFDKNKSLKILLPLLVIAIIAVMIVYSTMGGDSKPASTQLNSPNNGKLSGQAVDVLPQIERAKGSEIDKNIKDPFSSGNTAAIALKGIIIYEDKSTAIIETQESSYVVSEGDKVEGWTIKSIDSESVLLFSAEGNEITLKYEQ
jgi:hypothetical protein